MDELEVGMDSGMDPPPLASASPTMAEEMSEAEMEAPRRARGMAREPVPHPASHTVTPSILEPVSQSSTLSTVCWCPSRMSSCTSSQGSFVRSFVDS